MLLIAQDEKKNVPLLTWQQEIHMEYVSYNDMKMPMN